jgi:RHS repeat-associated protein
MVWNLASGLPLLLNDATAHYIYGPGGTAVEQIKLVGSTATPTYLHQDQLNSTVLITTSAGTVADTYTYDPFGAVTAHTGTTNTSLQFNGQYLDSETGLIYLRARYYHPATAQFLSLDPLASVTRARYSYASGNPLSSTDPSGLVDWGIVGTVALVGAAALGTAACVIAEPCGLAEAGLLVAGGGTAALSSGVTVTGASVAVGPAVFGGVSSAVGAYAWMNAQDSQNAEDCPDSSRTGGGKNAPHGDDGRRLQSAEQQIRDLEAQLRELNRSGGSRAAKRKIQFKIQRIRQDGERAKSGENHSRRAKGAR